MTVSGNDDAIVIKYNSSGSPQWSMNFGGNGTVGNPSDQGRGIDFRTTTVGDLLFVTGYYCGSGTFANWSSTYASGFAIRITDNGTSASIGPKNTIIGSGSTVAYRTCLSADNSIWYVVGSMTGNATIRLGGTPAGSFANCPGAGSNADGFVIAFGNGSGITLGDYRWIGGDDDGDVVTGVTDLGDGKAYICGAYRSWYCWDDNLEINLFNTAGGSNDSYKAVYAPYGFRPAAEPTGIASITNTNNNFKVFPNPTSGKIVLHKENNHETTADITDVLGRSVKPQHVFTGNDLHIDLTDLQPGVYYIRLVSGGNKETVRIVKQ
jgi:hypothetical protein